MNNFFDILQEAKNPTSKPLTIKVQEEKTTDYTEDVEEIDDEQEETQEENQDNSTEGTDDNQEEESSNEDESEESEEETDSEDDEPTDYTEDANEDLDDSENQDISTDTDNTETEQQDLSPEEQEDAKKNARLIKNCITLYYNIISCINRLEKITGPDIETNKIILQVKSNLTDLSAKMYDFVTLTFNSNGYVKNLYIYNYFIEAFKINIEMLRKINTFENIS